MTAIVEPETHAAADPAGENPLDVAHSWATWASVQLQKWLDDPAVYADADVEPSPRLVSTVFIERAMQLSEVFTAIAAEQRAARQAADPQWGGGQFAEDEEPTP